MGFDSLRSLEIELKAAKEKPAMKRTDDDWRYINQIRESIVQYILGDWKDWPLYSPEEMHPREPHTSIEVEGAAFIFAKWCKDNDIDDIMNAYDNLSGKRTDSKGNPRWDLLEWYRLKGDVYVGGMILAGSCVWAELWYDDTKVAYIPCN